MAYQPAGNWVGQGQLSEQATVYYDRRGLDKLKAMLQFVQVCEPRPLPKGVGRTVQFYRFNVGTVNTNPVVDGVVGSPVALASATVSATVEEYNDFTSSSQLLEDTDIAPFVEEMVDNMSYRAALSNDTLARIECDAYSSAQVSTIGAYLSAADFKKQTTNMEALNIRPYSDGSWRGIIHPYSRYDLISDNTAGGFIETMKYQSGRQVLNGEIGEVGGVRIVSTTNVGSSGSAPNVLYNAYVFGYQSIFACDLSGSGPSMVADPKNQRFQTFVTKGGPSAVDPAGTIGTYVAYRFVTAYKVPYTSNDQYRFRVIQADASLV